jgi:hypothetical protein
MSALCQKQTSCTAANNTLFDHLIGAVDESGSVLIYVKERMEAGVGECWSGYWLPLAWQQLLSHGLGGMLWFVTV